MATRKYVQGTIPGLEPPNIGKEFASETLKAAGIKEGIEILRTLGWTLKQCCEFVIDENMNDIKDIPLTVDSCGYAVYIEITMGKYKFAAWEDSSLDVVITPPRDCPLYEKKTYIDLGYHDPYSGQEWDTWARSKFTVIKDKFYQFMIALETVGRI